MNERTFNGAPDKLRSQERLERLELNRVADLCLEGLSIKSMLDIGTGSGVFAEEFYKRNIEVAGVDLNPDMVDAAKEHIPNGEFKLGKAEEIPFDDKSFDMVFMGLVFHEVDDQLKTLLEAKRIAVKEIAILEWQYKDEEVGPPLHHRVKEELVLKAADEIGLLKAEVIPLKKLVLYKFLL